MDNNEDRLRDGDVGIYQVLWKKLKSKRNLYECS